MIQKIKKPISILLSLLMVLSVFVVVPVTASAAATYTKDSAGIDDGITLVNPGDTIYTSDTSGSLLFYSDITCDYSNDGTNLGVIPCGNLWSDVDSFSINDNYMYICSSYGEPSTFIPDDGKVLKVSYRSDIDLWIIAAVDPSAIPQTPVFYTKDSEGIADGIILDSATDMICTVNTSRILVFDCDVQCDYNNEGTSVFDIRKGDTWYDTSSFLINDNNDFLFINSGTSSKLTSGSGTPFKVSYDSSENKWHIIDGSEPVPLPDDLFVKVTSEDQVTEDNIGACTFSDAKEWVYDHWDEITNGVDDGYIDFNFVYVDSNDALGFKKHFGFYLNDISTKEMFKANCNRSYVTQFDSIKESYSSDILYLCKVRDPEPATYTVTWKNGETVLETDTVDKDTVPAYSGNVPEKAEDENYTYTFSGWTDGTNTYGATDPLPAVTGDITYTATYTATEKATEAPTELPDVIKDCTYQSADYKNVYANVPFIKGDDYSEFANGAILTLPGDNQGTTMVYDAKGYSYHLYDKTGTEIPATLSEIAVVPGSEVGLSDDVTVYRKTFNVTYPEGFDETKDSIYIVATVPELPEVIKDCTNTLRYRKFVLHANVPLTADPSDMSALPSGTICAPEADSAVALYDAKGYTYKFYDVTGAEIPLTPYQSTSMPGTDVDLSEDVTVYLHIYTGVPETCSDVYVVATVPTTFTVTWKNGETVLETDENVAQGTMPEYNGTTPVKDEDDDYIYTFKGWSPEIAAVTGDVTYTATFDPTAKYEAGYYVVGTMNNWAIDPAYKLAENPATEGEYMLNDLALTATDEIKIIYAEPGEGKKWYPEGMDNNMTFSKDGSYNIYFRPDGQGGDDWYNGLIYAKRNPPAESTAVIDLINALPTDVTLADAEQIEAARAAYDALTDDQKSFIDEETLNKLTDAEEVIADREAAKAVEDQINALPDDITLADKAAVDAANEARLNLTPAQADYLTFIAIDKLFKAQDMIRDLEAVKAVEDMIKALPAVEDITLNDKDAVQAANDAFAALTNEQVVMLDGDLFDKLRYAAEKIADLEAVKAVEDMIKALPAVKDITLNDKDTVNATYDAFGALTDDQIFLLDGDLFDKLDDAKKKIADLEEAKVVEDKINALPDVILLEDKADVEDARIAYDALEPEQKDLIDLSVVEKLEDAEEVIADREAAKAVEDMISALPDDITLADKAAVDAANEARLNLTPAQADYLTFIAIDKLFKAQDKIRDLEAAKTVEDMINALPTDVTVDNKEQIEAARQAYDALTDDQKALVTPETLEKLTDAETTLDNIVLLGDVDGDGEVTISDATLIQRYDVMMIDLTDKQLKAADVDGDGNVSIIDVTWLQRYLAEMPVRFPINEYI